MVAWPDVPNLCLWSIRFLLNAPELNFLGNCNILRSCALMCLPQTFLLTTPSSFPLLAPGLLYAEQCDAERLPSHLKLLEKWIQKKQPIKTETAATILHSMFLISLISGSSPRPHTIFFVIPFLEVTFFKNGRWGRKQVNFHITAYLKIFLEVNPSLSQVVAAFQNNWKNIYKRNRESVKK